MESWGGQRNGAEVDGRRSKGAAHLPLIYAALFAAPVLLLNRSLPSRPR